MLTKWVPTDYVLRVPERALHISGWFSQLEPTVISPLESVRMAMSRDCDSKSSKARRAAPDISPKKSPQSLHKPCTSHLLWTGFGAVGNRSPLPYPWCCVIHQWRRWPRESGGYLWGRTPRPASRRSWVRQISCPLNLSRSKVAARLECSSSRLKCSSWSLPRPPCQVHGMRIVPVLYNWSLKCISLVFGSHTALLIRHSILLIG